jgi:hypothetical protein
MNPKLRRTAAKMVTQSMIHATRRGHPAAGPNSSIPNGCGTAARRIGPEPSISSGGRLNEDSGWIGCSKTIFADTTGTFGLRLLCCFDHLSISKTKLHTEFLQRIVRIGQTSI